MVLMLPVLLQDPAGHASVTAATALGEDRGKPQGQDAGPGSRRGQEGAKLVDYKGPPTGW